MGRPTREHTASTTIVTFRITSDERELLEQIATRRKSSISDVLRALIRQESIALGIEKKASAG